ncbi:MAG: Tim44 domain-containing protein [Hydrogenophaga sp.]|uniref:Tim44 domain-containing protein n=1 Tax=Hydrogenophaga sp. TaxID=1904254 RepID=UPI0025C1DF6D|nr:Tim44-like domain-containing protein [Hydrogenophaga sp.]MBT9553579.1 Tim44 domain-containing protein [Hydrogenophaga sp.]
MSRWWSLVLVGLMVLGSSQAVAKRLGSGTSVGQQSGQVTQPSAAQAPVSPAVSPAASAAGGPAATVASQQRPWGSVLGGVAAGLGLAWLASSLGLGEGFAQLLLLGVLALVALTLFRTLARRSTPALATPGAYAASAEGGSTVTVPRGYSPKNVGNDASARPWENQAVSPADGSTTGAAPAATAPWGVPAGFDIAGFLQASKANFVSLQDAWDRADIPSLRAMMTDTMLAEIRSQLVEREHSGAGDNKTEVVMLEARLLGIEELASDYMASVEFSGLIREDMSAGPNPFREVWNITRPKSNASGWLVAGVQALQ